MNRIAYIRMFLTSGLAEQGVRVTWVRKVFWDRPSFTRVSGDHHPMGFSPAGLLDGALYAFVCAEVLVERTAHLSDESFIDFVDSVRTHLHLHISQLGLDMPEDLLEVAVLAMQREITGLDFDLYESIARGAER